MDLSTLYELLEYFDDRADVDDGIPNTAMRFLVEVKAAIARAEEATNEIDQLRRQLDYAMARAIKMEKEIMRLRGEC